MILEKEKDMSQQAVTRAEENERKRIAADLHDSLGAYAASIASNIAHLTNVLGNGFDKGCIRSITRQFKRHGFGTQ
jgi:signal transduction histidine kinase